MNPIYPIGKNLMGEPLGPSSPSSSPWLDWGVPNPFTFLEKLDILYFYKLDNDLIYHNLHWPPLLHNIPVDILKFEGKQGDHLATDVTTYHLWCVSKSMVDDSAQHRLFPRTLIGNSSNWYIELPHKLANTFGALETEFLKDIKLPICYKTRENLFTILCQHTYTHISDHIHEWRHRRWLLKAPIGLCLRWCSHGRPIHSSCPTFRFGLLSFWHTIQCNPPSPLKFQFSCYSITQCAH